MKAYFPTTARLLAGLAALMGAASAQSFTEADIDGFVTVLEGMQTPEFEEEMDDALGRQINAGALLNPTAGGGLGAFLSPEGEFVLFRRMTDRIAKTPAADRFGSLVDQAGFADAQDFAVSADAITLAFLGQQMVAENVDVRQMRQMVGMMPKEMRGSMEGFFRIHDAATSTTADDRALVASRVRDIENAFDN